MKKLFSLGLFGWLVAMAGGSVAFAQSYSINWYKIAGGGGTSTNGQLSVSGTIGQPDAGRPMTNGIYSLTGGFWSFSAVAMPGAPVLSIFLAGSNNVVVAWPAPSTGFVLQQNADVTTTNWVAVAGPTNVLNSQNQVNFSSPAGQRYFRLVNP